MTTGRMTLRVASPCTESWEGMAGDERQRFCNRCQLNVYNLSVLSLSEQEELVLRTEGKLCGRLYLRRDGTALTRDCPVGLRRARARLAAGVSTATALVCATFFAVPALFSSSSSFNFGRSVHYWRGQVRDLPGVGPLLARLLPEQEVMGGLVMEPLVERTNASLKRRDLKPFGAPPPSDEAP